jgi:hypothetical protein
VLTTVVYSLYLENREPRRIILLALIIISLSYLLGVFVFANFAYDWYIGGLVQATFLQSTYWMLMWLPAYVLTTKMIPYEVETIMNSIVKTL